MGYSVQNAPAVRKTLAERTKPAAGWCDRLYRDGEKRAARTEPKNQGFGEGPPAADPWHPKVPKAPSWMY